MATLTLLFVDQVGSTAQLDALGDAVTAEIRTWLLAELRGAVRANGGREVELTGDGLFASFPSATDAVTSAVAMQRAVRSANAGRDEPRRVGLRIGVHTGEPTVHDDGRLFGLSVVAARRLCDLAGADEIYVSSVTRALAAPTRAHTFEPLGPMELKGITEPVEVWSIVWEGAAASPTRTITADELAAASGSRAALDPEPTMRQAPASARLVLPSGDAVLLSGEPCIIGRQDGCTIVVDDTNVSRRHAEVRVIGSHVLVRDLGSTNGTLLNGVPVVERIVVNGDQLQIGDTVLRVVLGDADLTASPWDPLI
jgi:class 3 adenylate cyclase